MNWIILIILFLPLSIFAYADFSYKFAQITHTTIDDDDFGDATTIDLDVSFETSENIFLSFGYGAGDFDDIDLDLDVLQFGVGYHAPISESADFVSRVEYVEGETDGLLDSDLDGYGISVGVRAQLAEKVEVLVGVIYSDIDVESGGVSASDSDTDLAANIALNLTDSLQAVIDIDGDDQSLGLGLYF